MIKMINYVILNKIKLLFFLKVIKIGMFLFCNDIMNLK